MLNCIRKTLDVIFICNLIAWFLVVKLCTCVSVCVRKKINWSLFLTQLTAKSHFRGAHISSGAGSLEAPGINFAEIGKM